MLNSSNALIREFKEETGAGIICSNLVWTEEYFYTWNNKKANTIAFYYLIKLCENSNIPDNNIFSTKR